MTGRLIGNRVRKMCPDACVAIGLEFGANRTRLLTLRVGLRAADVAELILDVMPELVSDHVLLCERSGTGTETVDEQLEKARIEVRRLVRRAVERTDITRRLAATGVDRTAEQNDFGSHVRRAGLLDQLLFPNVVEASDGQCDAAVHIGVCLSAGALVDRRQSGRRTRSLGRRTQE